MEEKIARGYEAELIEQDYAKILEEIAKREDYVRHTSNPKNAGAAKYTRIGEEILIRFFAPLPEDFLSIVGEQFALGSENDTYDFVVNEDFRAEYEAYLAELAERGKVDGVAFIPVIYHSGSATAFGFPTTLRGIPTINVAKREYKLYVECMKLAMKEENSKSYTAEDIKATVSEHGKKDVRETLSKEQDAKEKWKEYLLEANGTTAEDTFAWESVRNAQRTRILLDAEHAERKALIREPKIEGEKKTFDEMDPIMKLETFGVTPLLAILFFAAAVFSYQLQGSGDSGPMQTFFLVAMGVGFLAFGIYHTFRVRNNTLRHNAKVRTRNEENRRAFEAACAAEDARYAEALEGLEDEKSRARAPHVHGKKPD